MSTVKSPPRMTVSIPTARQDFRVLLVEDNPDDVLLIDKALTASGAWVLLKADRLSTALDTLARAGADAVLLDLSLPDASGVDAVRRIRGTFPLLPLLVLTGLEDEAVGLEALHEGAQDYLLKSQIDGRLLGRALRYAIERTQADVLLRQRESELAAALREERFHSLIEDGQDLILVIAADGTVTYESPSIERVLGYEPRERIGRSAFELFYPDDLAPVRELFLAAVQEGRRGTELDVRVRAKDGSWRALQGTARNFLDRPEVAGIVVNLRDVTGRKRAETEREELLRSERAARAAAEQAIEEAREGRERLAVASRRLVEIQESERRLIAKELHDQLGQMLTGVKLLLQTQIPLSPDPVRARLAEAQEVLGDLTVRVRDLSLNLRPAMLDDFGLLSTLLWHFERYTALTQVQVRFAHQGAEGRFAPDVETAAYRIVQEALTNIARYAQAGEAVVSVWADENALWVQVDDEGCGFSAEAVAASRTSTGLAGMRERAELLGGRLSIESTPGVGTRILAELPLGGLKERSA